MTDVTGSSQIARIGHDPAKNHLFVQFWRKPSDVEREDAQQNGRLNFRHANWKAPEPGANSGPVLNQVPGSIYRYENFTADHHAAFVAAPSKGKRFGAHVKGKFTHLKVSE
jgi:hypothetical protein